MSISDLKEKEALYEVVEPRYFEKAESLSEQDDQGAIYEFLLNLAQRTTKSGYLHTRLTTILK